MPKGIAQKIAKDIAGYSEEISAAAAKEVVRTIRSRTQKAQSVSGVTFVPLAEKYAKRVGRKHFVGGSITKALRIEKTKQGHKVRMRSGATSRGTRVQDAGQITNVGAPERRTKTGTPNPLPQREWWGVSESLRRRVLRQLASKVQQRSGGTFTIHVGAK